MPGPRSTSPAPAGSVSIRPRACSRRGTHSPGGYAVARSAPRPSRARTARPRWTSPSPCASSASARRRASPSPTARSSGQAIARCRRRRGGKAGGRRRAAQRRRRADLRGARRRTGAGVEHRRSRAHQARRMPTSWRADCASGWQRAACCTTARASGIPASRRRAGRFAIYWRADGEALWHDPTLIAEEKPGARGGHRRRGRGSPPSCAAGSGSPPTARFPPTRTGRTSC